MEELDKIFDFILEADKEKLIGRQNYLSDGSRKENDAEHAWHMAIMAVLLGGFANEKIDILKTVTMLLIHDLIEIDAGDTFAYDTEAAKTKRERELKCADRLFSILPDKQGRALRALWEEFEENKTPEAKFAYTLDHIHPLMLNSASGGRSWTEHGIRLEQVMERNEKTSDGSAALWEYAYSRFIAPNVEKGILK